MRTIGIFNSLSKYKPTEKVTAEENFATHLLASILRYSQQAGTELLTDFAELFGIEMTAKRYGEYQVLTQEPYQLISDNIGKWAFPDLVIQSENDLILIEVKVEASINLYQDTKDVKLTHNQVQKYAQIATQKQKQIFILSKYRSEADYSDVPSFGREVNWREIWSLLNMYLANKKKNQDQAEAFLLTETISYLEEGKMSVPKVSYELMNGLGSFMALMRQLEIVVEKYPHRISAAKDYYGCYLYKTQADIAKQAYLAWVGTRYDGTKLVFENLMHKDKEVKGFSKQKGITYPFAEFVFEDEAYFCHKPEKQVQLLSKWITANYELLVSL